MMLESLSFDMHMQIFDMHMQIFDMHMQIFDMHMQILGAQDRGTQLSRLRPATEAWAVPGIYLR